MKRILHVVSCLEYGGTEAYIMNNYRNIDKKEYEFDFLVFIKKDYPLADEIRQLGGHVYFSVTPKLGDMHNFIKKTAKIIKENGPYIAVHSHVNIANCWVMLSAKKAGVKIRVSHSHATSGMNSGELKNIYRRLELRLLKAHATHFLACSPDAGSYLYGKRFFEKHGALIHNGIELNKFMSENPEKTKELEKQFDIRTADLVVGNITRFDKNKNIGFLIDVFNEILKIAPKAVLLLGGTDGGELDSLKDKTKRMNIDGSVRFIGVRNDISDCLKLINVYVVPSLSEGLSFALLEAEAAGCECVASTGVPSEADMDIGNLTFLDLNKGHEYWAKK